MSEIKLWLINGLFEHPNCVLHSNKTSNTSQEAITIFISVIHPFQMAFINLETNPRKLRVNSIILSSYPTDE